MNKTIYVLGSKGMLGNYAYRYFKRKGYNVQGITRKQLTVSPNDMLYLGETIGDLGIKERDIIINCIGLIPQRNKEDVKSYIIVNSYFPHLLQEICENIGAQLIHITTDCVFSGKIGGYNEDSPHDELGMYGRTKSIGEPPNACIIRTSIIGEELHNKLSLLEWVKSQKGQTINGYFNHIFGGVTCLELIKFIDGIILLEDYWEGVRHYTPTVHKNNIDDDILDISNHSDRSSTAISKFELLKIINEVYDLNIIITPQMTERVDRSLSSNFKMPITPTIREQIIEQKEFNIYE